MENQVFFEGESVEQIVFRNFIFLGEVRKEDALGAFAHESGINERHHVLVRIRESQNGVDEAGSADDAFPDLAAWSRHGDHEGFVDILENQNGAYEQDDKKNAENSPLFSGKGMNSRIDFRFFR